MFFYQFDNIFEDSYNNIVQLHLVSYKYQYIYFIFIFLYIRAFLLNKDVQTFNSAKNDYRDEYYYINIKWIRLIIIVQTIITCNRLLSFRRYCECFFILFIIIYFTRVILINSILPRYANGSVFSIIMYLFISIFEELSVIKKQFRQDRVQICFHRENLTR